MCNAHCACLCRYDLFLIVSKTNGQMGHNLWLTSTHGCWIVQLAKLNCRAEDGREQHQMASVPSVPHRSSWTSGIWPRWLLNVYFYPVSTCMAGFYWFEKNYIYLISNIFLAGFLLIWVKKSIWHTLQTSSRKNLLPRWQENSSAMTILCWILPRATLTPPNSR